MGLDFNVGVCITHDCFSLMILFLILTNFGEGIEKKHRPDGNLFRMIIISIAILLMSDIVKLMINGKGEWWVGNAMLINQGIYYFFQAFVGMVWLSYCICIIKNDESYIRRGIPLFVMFTFIVAALCVLSCFTPLIFYIDENNVYFPGLYKVHYYFFSVAFYVYAFILILKDILSDKEGFRLKRNIFLIFFPLPGLMGSIIQTYIDTGSIIWSFSTITALILYYNIQNEKVTTDGLTGVNNRYRFNVYLESKYLNLKRGYRKNVFLIIIDVDDFKSINDNFGHSIGDEALKNVAKILIRAMEPEDFIARMGGDEFAVICERDDMETLPSIIDSIKNQVNLFNEKREFSYSISLSVGACINNNNTLYSVEEMIHIADQEMYKDKQSKKNPLCIDCERR